LALRSVDKTVTRKVDSALCVFRAPLHWAKPLGVELGTTGQSGSGTLENLGTSLRPALETGALGDSWATGRPGLLRR
jgi:hypothetical protein